MNEKDFNRAVLSQLYEISAQVFCERVTVHRDGKEVEDEQFNASEIVNGKDSIGREIEIRLKGEPEVFTVEIDGFKCSFAAEGVFNIVAKFEKLAGVSSKKRMKYLKGSCVREEIINEKSMYPLRGKATTKKKKLIKLSEKTAFCFDKNSFRPYTVFYKCGGMWYFLGECISEAQARKCCNDIGGDKWVFERLADYDFERSGKPAERIIFSALLEALKAERMTEEEAGTVQNEEKQEERPGQMDEQANEPNEPNERQDRYKGIHTGIKGPDGFANTISHYETDAVKTRPNNRAYVGYLATFGIIRNRGST